MRIARSILAAGMMAAAMPVAAQQSGASAVAAEAPAAVEPARLAAAQPVIDKLFPVGTYQRMMRETLDKLMVPMMDSVLEMPVSTIAAIGGLDEEQAATLDQGTLAEVMAIYDPHFRKRTQRGMQAMMTGMNGLMAKMEPRVRNGLARAYARKFTAAQLDELSRFFATPTGGLYASESLMLFVDPELVTEMQAFVPELMEQMPAFVKAMEAATADLPRPRKIEDLSAAERTKLARLLGVKPGDLREPEETPNEDVIGD